jgi:hypothetical protein
LHRSDCCDNPTPAACDRGGWPQFDLYGFSTKTTKNAALPWTKIQQVLAPKDSARLCGSTPFAFSWQWDGDPGFGHMMVGVGYNSINGVNWITVGDPLPVNKGTQRTMTYDTYVSASGQYSHWNDYMISNNLLVTTPLIFFLVVSSAASDELNHDTLQVPKDARAAALNSLQTFRQLASAPNKPDIIAGGPGAAADVSLGSPVQDSIIRLSELRQWDGKDPSSLVHLTGRIIFPIVSRAGDRQITQSSMTLAKKDAEWSAIEFGAVAQAQLRDRIQEKITREAPGAPGGNLPAIFQVRVPTLNLTFLASQEDDRLYLTSMDDIPSIKVTDGQKIPAVEMLSELQSATRELTPGAPN